MRFFKTFIVSFLCIYSLGLLWIPYTPQVWASEKPNPFVISGLPTTKALVLKNENAKDYGTRHQLRYKVERNYYLILSSKEQLVVSKEVKGHFEKAISKAEESFDEGEGDVSQSNITKLKLGLAGTENDIIDLEHNIASAKLELALLLGLDINHPLKVEEEKLSPEKFPYLNWMDFVNGFGKETITGKKTDNKSKNKTPILSKSKKNPGFLLSKVDRKALLELEKAFLQIQKSKRKMKLARKNRKITRALLVTELANYDFGIGDPEDLFEGLIIYTRVLKGYFETVYDFNVSVSNFFQLNAELFEN